MLVKENDAMGAQPEKTPHKRRRARFVRPMLLLIAYAISTGFYLYYNHTSESIYREALRMEDEGKYFASHLAYRQVADQYALSLFAVRAHDGMFRTSPAVQESSLLLPRQSTVLEEVLGSRFAAHEINQPALVGIFIATGLFFFAIIVLRGRPIIRTFSVVAALFCTSGLVLLAVSYNWVDFPAADSMAAIATADSERLYWIAVVACVAAMIATLLPARQVRDASSDESDQPESGESTLADQSSMSSATCRATND